MVPLPDPPSWEPIATCKAGIILFVTSLFGSAALRALTWGYLAQRLFARFSL